MSTGHRFLLSLILGWIVAAFLLVIGGNTSNEALKKTVLWQVDPIVALAGDGPVLYTNPDGTTVHEGTPVHFLFFVVGLLAGFVIYPGILFLMISLAGKLRRQKINILLLGCSVSLFVACSRVETNQNLDTPTAAVAPTPEPTPTPIPTPAIPNLQAELIDDRNKTTTSPIGAFDFKNYTYEMPRGWQNPDGTAEIKIVNGRVPRVERDISEKLDDNTKAEIKAQRRIGLSFVTTKYFDVTGDGQDEALVILKIETGGGAVPQVVYVFTWKDDEPELIWPFRTGDRADGGLKDLRAENGELVVELYGQDRFLLGQTETGKVTGDEEQLCCPTYFTRTRYKWNGKNFLMQKKRLTYSIADPDAAPVENMGDIVNNPQKKSGKK